jgi:NadR type nicotinamide-nucleotide adenylyltransferase
MFKIAITGPESTGKTALAEQLADHYNTIWVPEYSRKYLEKTNGLYSEKDLVHILEGQIEAENEQLTKVNRFLFCDTDPLVIWIWSKVKFGRVDQRIEKALKDHHYDFYLLTYPDLPWEKDELRESEGRLNDLFEMYLQKLKELGRPYAVIPGSGNDRLKGAIDVLDSIK